MQPGLPPYEEWVTPSPEVRLSVYIFSVENPDAFLNGTDEKLRLVEIGPIIYREYLQHQNVTFHDNSTLSYTAHRNVEFLEDQNEKGILDRVILVPNFVLLVINHRESFRFWPFKCGAFDCFGVKNRTHLCYQKKFQIYQRFIWRNMSFLRKIYRFF